MRYTVEEVVPYEFIHKITNRDEDFSHHIQRRLLERMYNEIIPKIGLDNWKAVRLTMTSLENMHTYPGVTFRLTADIEDISGERRPMVLPKFEMPPMRYQSSQKPQEGFRKIAVKVEQSVPK